MSGELQVLNLADQIRDKVRTTILNSIPDEQVDKLIKKEWEAFFEIPTNRNSWDSSPKESPFTSMVKLEIKAVLENKLKEKVQEKLLEFDRLQWDNAGEDAFRKMIQAYGRVALAGLGEELAAKAIHHLQQNRNSY